MLVVRWADEATEDLATIFDYIDQRNPSAARRLYDDIVIPPRISVSDRFCIALAVCPAHARR